MYETIFCRNQLHKYMTKEEVTKLLNIYGKAWVTRDPDLIVTIFTPEATYNDPHEPENIGRDAIRACWVSKVVGEQKDIVFDLKHVWIDGGVETSSPNGMLNLQTQYRNLRIQMDEVAIFQTRDGEFSSLREYYKSVKTPLV